MFGNRHVELHMKLETLVAAAAVALLAGTAVAQDMAPPVTMQPIPNPPETVHHGKVKHHVVAKHHKAEKADMKAAPK